MLVFSIISGEIPLIAKTLKLQYLHTFSYNSSRMRTKLMISKQSCNPKLPQPSFPMFPKLQPQNRQGLRLHPPITLHILLPRLQSRRPRTLRPYIQILNIFILLLILLNGLQQILRLLQPYLRLRTFRFIEVTNIIFLHIDNPIRKSRNR